jgi:hypothetical protein
MDKVTPKWEERFDNYDWDYYVLSPHEVYYNKKQVKRFIQSTLNQSNEESEKARQSGYEVGYAQGESDSGIPHSMIEFIKQESVQEERKRIIAWANKMFKSGKETWVNLEDLINFINK